MRCVLPLTLRGLGQRLVPDSSPAWPQYVLPAYLVVFVVGILLGLALSPATPEELEWLAARAERLQGGHSMPGRAAARGAHLGASQLRGGQPHRAGEAAAGGNSMRPGVSRSHGTGQPNGAGESTAEVQAGGQGGASNSSLWSVEVRSAALPALNPKPVLTLTSTLSLRLEACFRLPCQSGHGG